MPCFDIPLSSQPLSTTHKPGPPPTHPTHPTTPHTPTRLQDETFYEAYNHRFGELHGPISFEPHRQAAADFKHNILYDHIAGGCVVCGCGWCCGWEEEVQERERGGNASVITQPPWL